MAIKIAQMIVNDITIVTMGAPLVSETQCISSLYSREGSHVPRNQERQTRDASPTT